MFKDKRFPFFFPSWVLGVRCRKRKSKKRNSWHCFERISARFVIWYFNPKFRNIVDNWNDFILGILLIYVILWICNPVCCENSCHRAVNSVYEPMTLIYETFKSLSVVRTSWTASVNNQAIIGFIYNENFTYWISRYIKTLACSWLPSDFA